MEPMSIPSIVAATPAAKRIELKEAVCDLRDRGLFKAAAWAAEQLMGLPDSDQSSQGPSSRSRPGEGAPGPSATPPEEEDEDSFLLARSCFDLKEYRRCAFILKESTAHKSVFLRMYATYLAGERRREEERIESSGPLGKVDSGNKEIERLEAEFRAMAEEELSGDGFYSYLFGLILIDREQKAEARSILLLSVQAYPCNWSAWQALLTLCSEREPMAEADLPAHWVRDFFMTSYCLDQQRNEDGLERLRTVSDAFPRSDWVLLHAATAQYNLRNFDDAQDLFEDLLSKDPHRIEGVDTYSNILYVKEMFGPLSHLAHRAVETDKYRPETCCTIGNYYSLKHMHEKAVEYFRRALKLDRHYLSAWTLMGHEYVEMKNPPAAIDAYRRAVDLNPRDYRAWYGLGQTYELLHMPYYALYYFRRAAQLRPNDARMWNAMGLCYSNDQLRMMDASIRCYKRSVANGDRDGIALLKLAKLYEARNQTTEAALYHRRNLARMDEDGIEGADTLEALLFLATFAKDQGNYDEAEAHCIRLLDHGHPSKERAKQLLREVQSLRSGATPQGGMLYGGNSRDAPGTAFSPMQSP